MKKKLFTFIILSCLLFLGCSENESLDPSRFSMKTGTEYLNDKIPIGITTGEFKKKIETMPGLVGQDVFVWRMMDGWIWTKFGTQEKGDPIIIEYESELYEHREMMESVTKFLDDLCNFSVLASEEKFSEFQHRSVRFEKLFFDDENNYDLVVAVMFARISENYSWSIDEPTKLGDLAKRILNRSSELGQYVADDNQVDPSKLDVWWASYFITGEEEYLDKILAYAGEEIPEGESDKVLVVEVATWSFKSNCAQHESVRKYAERSLNKIESKHKIGYIKECINQ